MLLGVTVYSFNLYSVVYKNKELVYRLTVRLVTSSSSSALSRMFPSIKSVEVFVLLWQMRQVEHWSSFFFYFFNKYLFFSRFFQPLRRQKMELIS